MSDKRLLIVFARNLVKGQVKTRLAKSLGDDRAFDVYAKLLNHTLDVSMRVDCDKVIYYSDFIPAHDQWKQSGFFQALQQGNDLGERMMHAFDMSFKLGYNSICIIGTDCFELSTAILIHSFNELKKKDVVIGPAKDGGYYLLGLTSFIEDLFLNKAWSSDKLFSQTVESTKQNNLTYCLLEKLSDIDTEEDLLSSSLLTESHL